MLRRTGLISNFNFISQSRTGSGNADNITDREPGPVGPGHTVMSAVLASNPGDSTLTYQEQLAGLLRWKAGAASYDRLTQQRQADFDALRDPSITEYLSNTDSG